MAANETLLQAFEWHFPSHSPSMNKGYSTESHYTYLRRVLPSLARIGVTGIWLPPGCKANNSQGNGYDCYDLWDLGEYDQKGGRATKWGVKEELSKVMQTAEGEGIQCIWDTVLNHKAGGDATEETWAVEVDEEDRRIEICSPKKIEAWLRFDFPGRERDGVSNEKFLWRAEHFNGTDWDHRAQKRAIYKIIDDPFTLSNPSLRPDIWNDFMWMKNSGTKARTERRAGKGWAEDVDDQHGNADYLMFSNIDYSQSSVQDHVKHWGEWMVNDVGVDGFRLDAAQHFSYSFTRDWISVVQQASWKKRNRELFIVGEIWTDEPRCILDWLNSVGQNAYAYDSPLLYNFSRISEDIRKGSKSVDLRTILHDSLLELRPQSAVTFVTNHDTQPGQTSYAPIDSQLKSFFYAFILLRREGRPCVFWGDLYGTNGPYAEPPACTVCTANGGERNLLPDLIMVRKYLAYGEQKDYFDSTHCIGFTRSGVEGESKTGCAIIISVANKDTSTGDYRATKRMRIGKPGEVWVDILCEKEYRTETIIDAKGYGLFSCGGMGIGVFSRRAEADQFSLNLNLDS